MTDYPSNKKQDPSVFNIINNSSLDPTVKEIFINYQEQLEGFQAKLKNAERNILILLVLIIVLLGFILLGFYILHINPNVNQCTIYPGKGSIESFSKSTSTLPTLTLTQTSVPTLTPTPTPKPKLRVFVFNSQISSMVVSTLQKYLIENLKEYENIDIKLLDYNNNTQQFISSQGVVSNEILKESLNLYIFHKTSHKIEGQWSKEKYDKLLTYSSGNCVWTYTEEKEPLHVAIAPNIPDGVISGINLFTNHPYREKLKFSFYKNTFNNDTTNNTNLNKLRKLITAKFNLN